MRSRRLFAAVLLAAFTGCIGTDLVDDPLPTFEPRLEIEPPSAALILGDTLRYRAVYYGTTGEPENASITWTTSAPGVAAIDGEGLATAHTLGQAMITAAAADAVSEPAVLTVVSDPAQVATVTVEPAGAELRIGEEQTFTATARNLDGDVLSDKAFTWTSSAPDVATIDAEGRAVAVAKGTARIEATTDGVRSAAAVVTVLGPSRSGAFQARPGTSYNVAGTATLEEQDDGRLVLSFGSDFQSSNGPQLAVYLSPTNAVTGASRKLGDLKSTSGAQTYTIPDDVTLTTFDWVIIHCVPFNVTFGYAELR